MRRLLKLSVILVVLGFLAWKARFVLTLLVPMNHTGKVMRISQFSKGGWSSDREHTRQLVQFAIIFEDGYTCEGTDTSFAAIREGDVIEIRGYHDVRGLPLLDPEWWECDEAQLVKVAAAP